MSHYYYSYQKKTRQVAKKRSKSGILNGISIFFIAIILTNIIYTNVNRTHTEKFDFYDLTILFFVNVIFSLFINHLIVMFINYLKRYKYYHKTLKQIDKMTGVDFENYLKAHFEKKGYKVSLTPISNDYGADLILTKGKQHICVQAKRYSSSVGNKAIQEVCAAMKYYKCNKGMVVTNSYFTQNAINLAKANNIELWDRKKICKVFKVK